METENTPSKIVNFALAFANNWLTTLESAQESFGTTSDNFCIHNFMDKIILNLFEIINNIKGNFDTNLLSAEKYLNKPN